MPGGAVREVDIVPDTVVTEPAVVKTMSIAGAGIGWLPDFHAQDALKVGSLMRVLPHVEADHVDAHALYASHPSLSARFEFSSTRCPHQLASTSRG
jgi:DNA-binding transcriptional LysR family regulator